MAVENRLKKSVKFRRFALDLHFDPAIDQVSHSANNIVSGGNQLNGEPEPDALHAAFIKDSFCYHAWNTEWTRTGRIALACS